MAICKPWWLTLIKKTIEMWHSKINANFNFSTSFWRKPSTASKWRKYRQQELLWGDKNPTKDCSLHLSVQMALLLGLLGQHADGFDVRITFSYFATFRLFFNRRQSLQLSRSSWKFYGGCELKKKKCLSFINKEVKSYFPFFPHGTFIAFKFFKVP